jgi:hypothetical protein
LLDRRLMPEEPTDPILCNPLDLPYRYSDQTVQGFPRLVWREGADPSLVMYRDRYYLFVSMSGGFWHSEDLATWEFVATPDLPVLDYAPDIREVDGALVFSASRHDGTCSFWRTTDPCSGVFEEVPGAFAFWDPSLFQDDDGRVYLYWGCSNETPLYGVELERSTLQPIGDPVELIHGDHLEHGWEWKGEADGASSPQDRTEASGKDPRPFVEGAWMTKHAGRYVLQYAAPGTELNTYADGCYTAGSPLGPFTYAPDSPFSSVPGGFAPGAGHGSTIQDRSGNWWHAATIRISVNHVFERRIGLYPAGFDVDGVLFCNQAFADHPFVVPQRSVDPWTGVDTGWRLLSFGRRVEATSALDGRAAASVTDEDIRTAWVAEGAGAAEGVTVDLGGGCTVRAIQVNLADHDVAIAKAAPRPPDPEPFAFRTIGAIERPVPYAVELSADGMRWCTVASAVEEDRPHRLIVLDEPTAARFVRVLGGPGAWGSRFALSGVRVFGERDGDPPTAAEASAVRVDERTARVAWTGAAGAEGVNVRYGRTPEKLYHSWLVRERTDVLLTTLSAGEDYWVAVDAFNGSGVTPGRAVPVHRR